MVGHRHLGSTSRDAVLGLFQGLDNLDVQNSAAQHVDDARVSHHLCLP